MGLLKPVNCTAEISALKKARRRQMAFARYFNAQYIFPPEYLARLDPRACRTRFRSAAART